MSLSRWAAPLALATLLATAGCTDDGSATADPTPAASPTATTTPTPSPTPAPSPTSTQEPEPTPGPDFDRVDEVGAQAAAVYFMDLYSYMLRTDDEATFSALAWDKTCRFCENAIANARENHSAAAVIEGSKESVEILKVYPFDALQGGYPLDIRITETDGFHYDTNGDLVHKEDGGTLDARIELLHDGETWRLVNLLKLEEVQ